MTTPPKNNPSYCLLFADDDADDQLMIRDAFREINFEHPLHVVSNGEEVFDYLTQRGNYRHMDIIIPRVILLDLNMPRKDGYTVLREIRTDKRFNKIPVVIYSTSNSPQDISWSYELGANSYIVKPHSYKELLALVGSFNDYWFNTVYTPSIDI